MWAHGRFLTDTQADTIIKKVDLNKERDLVLLSFYCDVIMTSLSNPKKDKAIDYPEFLLVVTKRIINSGVIDISGITHLVPVRSDLTIRVRANSGTYVLLS